MTYGVVIVTKDRADLLDRCIGALKQGWNGKTPKPKIVVWDNGTDDKTPKVCKRYRVKRMSGEGNISFSLACNQAAATFEGDVVLINNDVFVDPGCLDAMEAARADGCDVVGAKLRYPDDASSPGEGLLKPEVVGTIQHYGVAFSRDFRPFHLLRFARLDDPSVQHDMVVPVVTFALAMINRKTWGQLDGLSDKYVFGYEDIDFCLAARMVGAVTGVVATATAIHMESQTAGRTNFELRNWVIWEKEWVQSGRIYTALGVFPHWLSDELGRVGGPDMAKDRLVPG